MDITSILSTVSVCFSNTCLIIGIIVLSKQHKS